ncbi:MAG: circumsporozoite protein [Sphingobium sp.]
MTKTIAFSLALAASLGLAACSSEEATNAMDDVTNASDNAMDAAENTMDEAMNATDNMMDDASNAVDNATAEM